MDLNPTQQAWEVLRAALKARSNLQHAWNPRNTVTVWHAHRGLKLNLVQERMVHCMVGCPLARVF